MIIKYRHYSRHDQDPVEFAFHAVSPVFYEGFELRKISEIIGMICNDVYVSKTTARKMIDRWLLQEGEVVAKTPAQDTNGRYIAQFLAMECPHLRRDENGVCRCCGMIVGVWG